MTALDDYLTTTPDERRDPRCDDCPAAEYGCPESPGDCVKPERVCGGCKWCVLQRFGALAGVMSGACYAPVPQWADYWPDVNRYDNADECECWEE